MITAANLYPKENVGLMPILDTLALLVQQPLCFTFLRGSKTGPYKFLFTTLQDPHLVAEFTAIIRVIENGGPANLICIPPENEIWLCIHCIRPEVKNGHLRAEFPELTKKDAALFKKLFAILHEENSGLGRDVLIRIAKSCSSAEKVYPPRQTETIDASYWGERRKIFDGEMRRQMIEAVRSIVDGAVAKVSESSLLRQLGKKRLPFENIFCVYRSATNLEPRCTHFLYDAQLVLSGSQRAAISKDKNFGESIPALMELPLGAAARSIADSVFRSGLVDFSDEQTGQGRDTPSGVSESDDGKRQSAELKVYGAIAQKRHVFYVPIHVSGVPWVALFTISPKSDKNATWAHNYAIYRSLISGVAEIIRTQAKATYLGLVKAAFVEEYRKQDKASFVSRINNRWKQLLLAFPFPGPQAELISIADQYSGQSFRLPDGRFIGISVVPNRWFTAQLQYDVLSPASVVQACDEATAEAGKESRTSKLEWEAQEHTIFNCVPIKKIRLAIESPDSELSGQARVLIEDAAKKAEIMEKALAIAFGRKHTTNLPVRVGALLTWLQAHSLTTEPSGVLSLPPEHEDFVLHKDDLHNAFTVLWNLWQNASNAQAGSPSPGNHFQVKATWVTGEFLVSLENENEGIFNRGLRDYLVNPSAPYPCDQKDMTGLMIVKTKMQALGWTVRRIDIADNKTTITIALGRRQVPGNAL